MSVSELVRVPIMNSFFQIPLNLLSFSRYFLHVCRKLHTSFIHRNSRMYFIKSIVFIKTDVIPYMRSTISFFSSFLLKNVFFLLLERTIKHGKKRKYLGKKKKSLRFYFSLFFVFFFFLLLVFPPSSSFLYFFFISSLGKIFFIS